MPRSPKNTVSMLNLYRTAEREVRAAGYGWEIEWQKNQEFNRYSESDLMREAAWVILCSGFKETSVRKCFDYISLCFCDWESAHEIKSKRHACITTALSGFGNNRKINAIAQIADLICNSGFSILKRRIQQDPINRLQEFPYIGPITSWHLAKNLGLNVAKNDRHLSKIAQYCGYSDAHSLCDEISILTGESASVIDIVLWRFAAMSPNAILAI